MHLLAAIPVIIYRAMLLLLFFTVSMSPASNAQMSEAVRSSIDKVVIVPGEGPADQAVTGSYRKGTAGLYGGMAAGTQAGTVISKDVGAVSLSLPIPILTYPGMIIGGDGKPPLEAFFS